MLKLFVSDDVCMRVCVYAFCVSVHRFSTLPHLFHFYMPRFCLHYDDGLFLWYFVDNFQHLKCYLTSGSGPTTSIDGREVENGSERIQKVIMIERKLSITGHNAFDS